MVHDHFRLIRGDDGDAGIVGRVARVHAPDDVAVGVLDGGIEELVAIDQDAAVLAAMRAVDFQRRVDQHVVLERNPHATKRVADHDRHVAKQIAVHHVHIAVKADIAGRAIIDQDVARDDAVELPSLHGMTIGRGWPVVDRMGNNFPAGLDKYLVVDDLIVIRPVGGETELRRLAVLDAQSAPFDASGVAEQLDDVATEIAREVAVEHFDGSPVCHDGHELTIFDTTIDHFDVTWRLIGNISGCVDGRARVDDFDSVPAFPLRSFSNPGNLLFSVAVDEQVTDSDVAVVTADPDGVNVG